MGLFDKIKNPIFLKEDSDAQKQLAALNELKGSLTGDAAKKLEAEIKNVEYGILGEKSIKYELENSHIPMLVLHDIYLEHNGLKAQIDYMIFTRKHYYVVECKNLYGNIEINSNGDFIRISGSGKHTVKEGIYSPITQNKRHLELIKEIRSNDKNTFITKSLFEKSFYENYIPIVVIANPKTVLYDKYAKKEVRSKVIRCDRLSEYIRRLDAAESLSFSEKNMIETANFFLNISKENPMDYAEKYRCSADNQASKPPDETALKAENDTEKENRETEIICPKCGAPMVKRKAIRGKNAGQEFFGCSRFPACRSVIQIKNSTET